MIQIRPAVECCAPFDISTSVCIDLFFSLFILSLSLLALFSFCYLCPCPFFALSLDLPRLHFQPSSRRAYGSFRSWGREEPLSSSVWAASACEWVQWRRRVNFVRSTLEISVSEVANMTNEKGHYTTHVHGSGVPPVFVCLATSNPRCWAALFIEIFLELKRKLQAF